MQLPERFAALPEYAFPRLRALLGDTPPGGPLISMSIGEPKHPFPPFVTEIIAREAEGFGRYPPNEGSESLRAAYVGWLARRYGATLDPSRQVMALNGTREGLFDAALALCPERKNGAAPAVLLPNPFYQCYAAAALAVGAEPVFVPATRATGYMPQYAALPPSLLDRTALVYVCSPSNPQGAVAPSAYWDELLALAERHDFIMLADECYSEIYRAAPPPGILASVAATGSDPERAVAFHSLSKRSSLPGLRSGFAAGGPRAIGAMKHLRSYGGAPLPLPLQAASEAVWTDEEHVLDNRKLYGEKFALADSLLGSIPGYRSPEAGFFLWLDCGDGEKAALRIWREHGVRVLPGAYLSRVVDGTDPGARYIRAALVGPLEETRKGLEAIAEVLG